MDRLRYPLVSLVLMIAAYGLLIGGLGYYWDDWMIPTIIKNDMSFWTFYAYNRPLSAWTFELLRGILGLNPFGWHLVNLIMRWVTGLTAWWALRTLWPNQKRAIEWMLYLFLLSPAFLQQVFAATYVQHFLIFPFYFISCALMMLAVKRKFLTAKEAGRSSFGFHVLALLSELVHVFSMEYFWGLEFLRPYMIWKSLPDTMDKAMRIRKTFVIWLPYLFIFISAVVWRFGFARIAEEDPNSLKLFENFFQAPFSTIFSFIVTVIRDMTYLFVTSWYPALQTAKMDVNTPGLVVSWVLVLLTIILLWFFLRKEHATEYRSWAHEAAWFGLYATMAGMLSTWAVSKELTVGAFSDRLSLSATLGVGIVIVALAKLVFENRNVQILFLSILVGLAVGYHFRLANDYRWYWQRQARFFWQYYWRVPGLQPNTGIIADGAQVPRVSDYAMSLAINTLNSPSSLDEQQPYWFFELDRNFTYDLRALFINQTIKGRLRNLYFEGKGLDVIEVAYTEQQCLWLLDESDSLNPALTSLTLRGLPASDPSRVIADAEPDPAMLIAIFGPEPEHDWCYHYEKANLAYYQQNWQTVIDLYHEATDKGYKTKLGFELKPFVIANAKLGQWNDARDLTLTAFERDVTSKQLYCNLWQTLLDENPRTDASDSAFTEVYGALKCKLP